MIDVHSHLGAEEFADDLEEVLERASRSGIEAILIAGENYRDNLKNLELVKKHPLLRACLGHYPSNLDREEARRSLELIHQHSRSLAAISEVGLDFRLAAGADERSDQKEIFSLFVQSAVEHSLPLVVHSRSAGHYVIDLLMELDASMVCLHAFDGKSRYAMKALERGYYFSIPPSVVRSEQKRSLLRVLPLDRILLESDAPVLGPEAEKRNEPSNIVQAVEEIARVKNLSTIEIRETTRRNTLRLFGNLTIQG